MLDDIEIVSEFAERMSRIMDEKKLLSGKIPHIKHHHFERVDDND